MMDPVCTIKMTCMPNPDPEDQDVNRDKRLAREQVGLQERGHGVVPEIDHGKGPGIDRARTSGLLLNREKNAAERDKKKPKNITREVTTRWKTSIGTSNWI